MDGEIDLLAGLSYTEERSSLINYPVYEMGLESYYIYKRAGDEAFADGTIDALIAVNNNVAANSGFAPVVMVGESSYYLGVTKGKPDLLEQLNNALAALKESNPFFIQSLQIKYFNHTAVNATLSREESAWVNSHSSIRVGYIDDYMPYCGSGTDGTVDGVITDVLREWQEQLGVSERIGVEYKAYPLYTDLIAALRSGEIDAAFPVHDSIWNSEGQGIVQTNDLVDSGVQLVYKGEYHERVTTGRIAVSDHSAFQRNFVAANYPESEVYAADTLEDCLEAVKQGKATCTFFDNGQAEALLSKRKYQTLNRLTLGEGISYCIGVKKGNNVMYSLLSRGISLIDKSDTTNAMYTYIGSGLEYSLSDFLLDHIGLVIAVGHVRRQAYRDSLTGFGNKRAYQDAVRQMEDKIKENRADFALAVFDLNGLKTINDTCGRELGDLALSDAGKCLKKVFGNARLFRFGGDEFIALEANSTLEEMRQRFALLDWELEEANRTQRPYVVPLSLAKGTAAYVPGADAGYMEVFKRADQAMYEDKQAYYEKHGGRPRR